MARGSISLIAPSRRASPAGRRLQSSRSTILHISVASRGEFAIHGGAAFELAESAAPGEHLHLDPQLVAGNHGPAEAGIVDGDEIEQLLLAVGNFLQQQQAARLRHGLDDQHARHDRLAGKMPLEIAFIDGDILDSDNALPLFHFFNGVNQQERDSGGEEWPGCPWCRGSFD